MLGPLPFDSPGSVSSFIQKAGQKHLAGLLYALVGYDRGETVTIPSLADDGDWRAIEETRLGLYLVLSHREVAPRYRAVMSRSLA